MIPSQLIAAYYEADDTPMPFELLFAQMNLGQFYGHIYDVVHFVNEDQLPTLPDHTALCLEVVSLCMVGDELYVAAPAGDLKRASVGGRIRFKHVPKDHEDLDEPGLELMHEALLDISTEGLRFMLKRIETALPFEPMELDKRKIIGQASARAMGAYIDENGISGGITLMVGLMLPEAFVRGHSELFLGKHPEACELVPFSQIPVGTATGLEKLNEYFHSDRVMDVPDPAQWWIDLQ